MNCACGHRWTLHGGAYFERWCVGWDAARGFCGCAARSPRELLELPVADLVALPGVIACTRERRRRVNRPAVLAT